MNISISDFEKNVQLYLKYIKEGKEIYLTQSSKVVALLSPASQKEEEKENKERPIGLAQGTFTVPDDFDDPLPDDYLNEFYK
jgi:antitoxin (DNA-binding transcriptional repressor) of toxin-antitoxin stability system